jgi:hypothetical protein
VSKAALRSGLGLSQKMLSLRSAVLTCAFVGNAAFIESAAEVVAGPYFVPVSRIDSAVGLVQKD